jgi:hypothetical protein
MEPSFSFADSYGVEMGKSRKLDYKIRIAARSEYSWSLNELRVNMVAAEVRYIVWGRILRILLSVRHSDFIEESGYSIKQTSWANQVGWTAGSSPASPKYFDLCG